jgi:DNA-binding CsgD family transcriptional regulator
MSSAEGHCSSREEVRSAINAWTAPRGYAFVIKRSSKTANGRTHVIFNCDRGAGRIPSLSDRRQTTTRRKGCLFSVLAKESLCKTIWSLRHRPGPHFSQHSHEPSFSEVAHPTLRQLSRQEEITVNQLTNAGIAPKEIGSFLRINSNTLATQRDIYNCIAKGRRDLS